MSSSNSESADSPSLPTLLASTSLSSPDVEVKIRPMKRIRPAIRGPVIIGEHDKAMLDEHLKYHYDMAKAIKRRKIGITVKNTRIPRAPKSKIEPIIKELNIEQRYYVKSYKPINTKYGLKYVLDIDDYTMWTTKAITKFITIQNLRPKDKFSFSVNYCGQFGHYADNFILNDYKV